MGLLYLYLYVHTFNAELTTDPNYKQPNLAGNQLYLSYLIFPGGMGFKHPSTRQKTWREVPRGYLRSYT
jgi:hypothetical protein